jgi:CRP/FNR family transcriptional regulator
MLADGRRQVVGLQFAPDLLGRLYGGESTVSAEAATSVELCSVPRPALETMIAESPALGQRLIRQTLRELDEARDWMVTLGRKTAGEKVASALWLIAAHADPSSEPHDGMMVELPLSRGDLADLLGLTIETVSRELTKLRERGVIEGSNARTMTLLAAQELRAAAG